MSCAFIGPHAASAVLIATGDGQGNTTAPPDQPGFSNVGSISGLSGVYVRNGWVLTTSHVGEGSIELGGIVYDTVPGSLTRFRNSDGRLTDLIAFGTRSFRVDFDDVPAPATGEHEADIIPGDSGGAALAESGSDVRLAGILLARSASSSQPANTSLYTNKGFAIDLFRYRDDILALIDAPDCGNGLDDDGDLLFDYPDDDGCLHPTGLVEAPEPSSMLMLASGALALLALLALRRRRACPAGSIESDAGGESKSGDPKQRPTTRAKTRMDRSGEGTFFLGADPDAR